MDIDVLAIAAVAITVVLFVLLSYLGRKKNVDFGILTILALVFGIVIGIIFKGHVELTAVFGRIYTNLISALVIPLLFVSIISSISSLDNISKLKTIGLKSIFWLVANTFTASLLTLIIAGSLKVGQSINFTLPTDYEPKEVPSFLDTIVGLFPKKCCFTCSKRRDRSIYRLYDHGRSCACLLTGTGERGGSAIQKFH